ncbi:MAG: UTRA domain-containing protein [Rhizobiales bacterium]|nr:UTRA domain-containing protein [Hyphomicrobiales bacterium]
MCAKAVVTASKGNATHGKASIQAALQPGAEQGPARNGTTSTGEGTASRSGASSLSETIQRDIEAKIMSGEWAPGNRIPNEVEFMAQYDCSRMTVNRVLSRLSERGLIVRRRKAGSFVAAPRHDSAMFLEIRDFAREAAGRGRRYRHEILLRRIERLAELRAGSLGLSPDLLVLRVLCLHVLDEQPHAYEDRVISLDKVPAVRDEPFETAPPGTWLLGHVPWSEARHTIRAVNADATLAGILGIETHDACLVLNRRTWHQSEFVTDVNITYPGAGYELTGQFSSTTGQVVALDVPHR